MVQWTSLGNKIPVKFWDPANISNAFSPQINPVTISRTPGNVRKYVKTANGTSIISGDREYPPIEIKMTWDELDYADYQSLMLFTAIDPIVFADNNNQGYLGVFVIDKAGQVVGKTKNVWAIEAAFLVLGPYNGQTGSILNLTPPSIAIVQNTAGGYINGGTTAGYLWNTVFTPWGESLVGNATGVALTATSGTNTNSFSVSWAQPSSTYYVKSRLYWNSTNDPTTATLLTEVQAGQVGSFTVYTAYAQYSTVNPPTYTTAFTGYWTGSLWTQAS